MLKKRLIPTLLVKDIGLVKGVRFDSSRRVGSVLPAVRVYNNRDVDELIILDIEASQKNQNIDIDYFKDFTKDCFVPLTIGGGIHTTDDIKRILDIGADKVSINSGAYNNPQIIYEAARIYGSQCIVSSIDVKKNNNGQYECYSYAGTKATGIMAKDWCHRVQEMGAGEILLTSIDRDGTFDGYDLELYDQVSDVIRVPLIASGGVGRSEDIYNALRHEYVSAAAAASVFHFTELTPRDIKDFLKREGVPVRF